MNLNQLLAELKTEPLRAMDGDVIEFATTVTAKDFQALRAAVKAGRTVQVSAWERVIKAEQAAVAGQSAGGEMPRFGDLSNAAVFAQDHRGQLRFVGERGWYRFATGRWEFSEWEAQTLASSVFLPKLVLQAREDGDLDAVAYLGGRRALESIVAVSRSDRSLCAKITDFDRDRMLLNVSNGTVNLHTGRLNPHNPEDMLTRLVEIEYDEAARCPQWKTFLDRVQPDPAVQKYLQRMMGYNLTGAINEQIFNIWHGTGANGKSTALEILQYCLGDNSRILPSEMLLNRQHEPHPTERAQLMGLRLAAFEETKKGKSFDENTVKQLVGQGTLTARFMRQDNFEFECTHKVIVCTNHRPKVSDCSHGFWRRTHLLPWSVEIPEEEKDRGLKQKLRDEAPGILRWMVEGCLEYQRIGLNPPPAVLLATAEYQAESDAVGLFLAERTRPAPNHRIRATDLYKAWKEWSEARGDYVGSQTTFGESLGKRVTKMKSSVNYYVGIRMADDGDSDEREDAHPVDDPANSQSGHDAGTLGTVAPYYTHIAETKVGTSNRPIGDNRDKLSQSSQVENGSEKKLGEMLGTGSFPEVVEEIVLDADGGFDL